MNARISSQTFCKKIIITDTATLNSTNSGGATYRTSSEGLLAPSTKVGRPTATANTVVNSTERYLASLFGVETAYPSVLISDNFMNLLTKNLILGETIGAYTRTIPLFGYRRTEQSRPSWTEWEEEQSFADNLSIFCFDFFRNLLTTKPFSKYSENS